MVRIFVGVAWPYSNGPFHIGHLAGAYLPGDIFARYHRLRGDEVLMVSGSDMHGTPTLVLAEKEGVSPQVVAERFDAINRDAFQRLGVSFDLYTHTHTIVHERTVQETFLLLLEHGFVRRRTEENAYCPSHQRFLPDRYLSGECPHCGWTNARGDECDHCGRVLEAKQLKSPHCRLCGAPAEFRPSEHFYLELDHLQPEIERFLRAQTLSRPSVRKTAQNFVDAGLHPTPITRDLTWGIPIPLDGYESKRFYVWFEAVIGYLSASREWAIRSGKPDAWRKFWDPRERARQYYFIGKDNIFHHTIVLPGILVGRGDLLLPYDVPANEWLNVEGRKVSKSNPDDLTAFIPSLLARYPPDVIRFYATRLAPQNHDTNLDWLEFDQLSEDILSNQYGNLVQRILVLTRDRCAGTVPEPPEGWSPFAPGTVGTRIQDAHAKIAAEYEAVHLKEALDLALDEVREENRRIHDAKPWQGAEDPRRATLYEGLWLLKAAAVWLSPVLPFSSAEIWRMLGYSDPPSHGEWDQALVPPRPGTPLGEIRPLFPRREETRTSAVPPSTPAAPTEAPRELPPLEIKAAIVRSVENHPSADRLYVLKLDAGEGTLRTVVAGMRPYYAIEELLGQRIVVLANLAPRTIRRITSQGMVLAAESGATVRVLTYPEEVTPGTTILPASTGYRVIEHAEFESTPIVVGQVRSSVDDGGVLVDIGTRLVRAAGRLEAGERVVVRLASPSAEEGSVLTFGPGAPIRPSPETALGARIR